MKTKFERDYSHWSVWLPSILFMVFLVGLYIVHLVSGRFDYAFFLQALVMGVILVVICRKPYELTDKNVLQGNGMIQVSNINRLEKLDKGVRVFYTWPEGKVERKSFFPLKDINKFISVLLEINPNIKLN